MKASIRALASFLILVCTASAHADLPLPHFIPLPRYHYTPGETLEYDGNSVFAYQNGKFIDTIKEQTWVVAQNPDGSWVLLTRRELKDHREESTAYHAPDETRISWMRETTFTDGHTSNVEATDNHAMLTTTGPTLPTSMEEMHTGWENKGETDTVRYTLVPSKQPARIVIHSVTSKPIDAIYLATGSADTTFDLNRGQRVSEVNRFTQGYGFVGESTGTTTLTSTGTETPERLKQLNDEFTAFMAAHKSTEDWITPGSTPDQIDVGAVAITAALKKAREDAPDFADVIDKELAGMKQSLDYEKKDAQSRLDLLRASALDWKTTDLKGAPHALADYRGQVVVLDFWYRGCGWCMLAMPRVIDAASHFAGRPVTFLAMTTDEPNSKDADFVVDKMKIPYPTLYAKDIAPNYKITGFPTLLVLDQQGIVRFIHTGYAKDLRDQIEANVESLLKAKN
jgi:thiol-disulfide isomerase/thioredoxin